MGCSLLAEPGPKILILTKQGRISHPPLLVTARHRRGNYPPASSRFFIWFIALPALNHSIWASFSV